MPPSPPSNVPPLPVANARLYLQRQAREQRAQHAGDQGDEGRGRRSYSAAEPGVPAPLSIREWALKQRKEKTERLQMVLAAAKGRSSFERQGPGQGTFGGTAGCARPYGAHARAPTGGGGAFAGASARSSTGEIDELSAGGGGLREPWPGPPMPPRASGTEAYGKCRPGS